MSKNREKFKNFIECNNYLEINLKNINTIFMKKFLITGGDGRFAKQLKENLNQKILFFK